MVIVGVNDNGLEERMLRESNLDHPKAIKLGQAAGEAKKHIRQLASEASKVNKVYKKKGVHSRDRFDKDVDLWKQTYKDVNTVEEATFVESVLCMDNNATSIREKIIFPCVVLAK